MLNVPIIDRRSRDQIFQILTEDLKTRLGIDAHGDDPFAEALLRIFSRYSELIIERLNKVPEKNFDAFLNVLKTSRIPPVPALAPLTFTPVKKLPGKGSTIYVPASTKVAAPPGEGETEPAVFETTRNLTLTNVTLKKLYSLDPLEDLYADKSFLASATLEANAGDFLFAGREAIPHEFYLAHGPFFRRAGISELRLTFTIEDHGPAPQSGQEVQWFIPSLDGAIPIVPFKDTTAQLGQSGEIVFRNLPEWPACEVFGRTTHWLCCRLLNRLPLPASKGGIDSPPPMPIVTKVTITASWSQDETAVESAFWNTLALDLSKDFFPLGEMPRFGDVLYLKSTTFAGPNASISLKVKMTNPASAGKDSPIPPVGKSGKPLIQWEYWDGRLWQILDCQDGTEAFIEDGEVYFLVPADFTPTTINGSEGPWVRARLVSGNYGEVGQFPSQTAPPCIQSIHLTSSLTNGPEVPENILVNNDFSFHTVTDAVFFTPFHRENQPYRAFYMGLMVPETDRNALVDATVDLYLHINGSERRLFVRTGAAEPVAKLSWQYWNGNDWLDLQVDDGTESLIMSGIVRIRTADDIVPWQECSFGHNENNGNMKNKLHWLRVLWTKGEYDCRPRVSRILLNTVPAIHTNTIVNEILGSSNGLPNQVFRSARRPLLQNLELEIIEPAMPSEEELETIRKHEDDDVLTVIRDRQGNIEEIRVRWHEVDDFLSSGNNDRYFVANRQKGEILFGDGTKGLIPPPGANNVRLRRYKTGGGSYGNKPAGCIKQLRNSVLYVDSVANLEAGGGGQDIEDWDLVRSRGASLLRHRGRAVTMEDYEDLAKLAAPTVAKAKCYPNRDLSVDHEEYTMKAGVVSLIVVPHSQEQRPTPDASLMRHVGDFLDDRRMPDVELILFEPEYVEIMLEVVVIASAYNTGINLVETCRRKLETFLHPLTGCCHGRGWEFGQMPHESDFHALLESVNGLETVRSLYVTTKEERPGLLRRGGYLIRSGQHKVRLDG